MGKPTGFIDYQRVDAVDADPAQRVQNFDYFHGQLDCQARQEQAGRCMDCGVPFCQAGLRFEGKPFGCPLRNLIPEWNDQLWNGNLEMALDRLLSTNCFPEFTGYVCPAPCEDACACGKASDPVSVNANERYIIEEAFGQGLMSPRAPKRRSGLSVAVVGSGPAGLTVAHLLNRRGHSVTVYEREKTAGGLLVYGIPSMKLPREVVARRIDLLKAEGVRIECGVNIGKDVTVDQLQTDFDAVVLAVGSQKPRVVAFDGWAEGVSYALDYLGAVTRSQLNEADLDDCYNAAGKVVAVVGAGDSANDCIATALRQGAKDVVQLIRRPESDYAPMTDYAHQEADAIFDHDIRRFQTKVAAVHANAQDCLEALTLTTPDGEIRVDADMLVIASGFAGPEDYVTEGVQASEEDGVFRAGDMALGSTLVVRAMADAREVARKVETYLIGYSPIR